MPDIICHIVGLNKVSKQIIIDNFVKSTQLNIVDIDELNELLFENNSTLKQLDKDINNLKNLKKNQKLNNNEKETFKFNIKKFHKLWKSEFNSELQNYISTLNKKIIIIGNSNIYNNFKIFCKINSKLKYILKIDYDEHCENIIIHNLENFKNDIIKGYFPIEYISKQSLVQKRKELENFYENHGYCLQTNDKIIFTIKSNLTKYNNLNIPIHLYYSSNELCKNKLYPFKGQSLIAYSDDAISLIALFHNSILINNELKIHYLDKNLLNKPLYLYKIASNNFIKYDGFDSKLYITSQYAKIIKTIEIKDIISILKHKGYCISYINLKNN
jgi:hypothetical protein